MYICQVPQISHHGDQLHHERRIQSYQKTEICKDTRYCVRNMIHQGSNKLDSRTSTAGFTRTKQPAICPYFRVFLRVINLRRQNDWMIQFLNTSVMIHGGAAICQGNTQKLHIWSCWFSVCSDILCVQRYHKYPIHKLCNVKCFYLLHFLLLLLLLFSSRTHNVFKKKKQSKLLQ